MGTTLTHIGELLKEIRDKIGSNRSIVVSKSHDGISLGTAESTLADISTTLSSILTDTAQIEIDQDRVADNVGLSGGKSATSHLKDQSAHLLAMRSELALDATMVTIEGVLDQIQTNTASGGGNTTPQWLDIIETLLSGLMLTAMQNIDTNTDGIEGLLTTMDSVLDAIDGVLDNIVVDVDELFDSMRGQGLIAHQTYQCTADGTLILDIVIPSNQKCQDWCIVVQLDRAAAGGSVSFALSSEHVNGSPGVPYGSQTLSDSGVHVWPNRTSTSPTVTQVPVPLFALQRFTITVGSLLAANPDIVELFWTGIGNPGGSNPTIAQTGTGTFTLVDIQAPGTVGA